MNSALAVFLAGTVAFFLVLLVLAVISLFLGRRKHRSATHTAMRAIPPPLLPSFPEECKSFDPSLPSLSVPLLTSATRDFHKDMVVGDSSFDLVYKALLPDDTCLAVKRLSPDYTSHGLREFRAEIETLGQLHHPNLCRFLGYCSSGPLVRLLVYKFLPLGSLDVWLHESPPSPPLPFPTRLHAVRGVASGLAFLHHSCSPPVIHRDIKSSNVLLTDDFSARIVDFGLARFLDLFRSHVSTQVASTMGYMLSEYRDGSTFATTKADVYSFRVLMLEVLSGQHPNLPVACEDSGRIKEHGYGFVGEEDGGGGEGDALGGRGSGGRRRGGHQGLYNPFHRLYQRGTKAPAIHGEGPRTQRGWLGLRLILGGHEWGSQIWD